MKIVFNGREYEGVDQMPPEIRSQYLQLIGTVGDTDGNGIPDILERPGAFRSVVTESITYNGREYKDRSELPEEVREALKRMPPPKPEDVRTVVEVKTKVLPIQEHVIVRRPGRYEQKSRGYRPGWLLVTMLMVIVAILLVLWLAGIRPGDLLRR